MNVILFLMLSQIAFCQVPEGHAVGKGTLTVTSESSWLRGLTNAVPGFFRRSIEVQIDFDHNGKMSVIQDLKLGVWQWQNRYDILWQFVAEIPNEMRYQLVHAIDGKVVGQAFCSPRVCEYDLDFAEQNLKISERLEIGYVVAPGGTKDQVDRRNRYESYDVMGTLTYFRSWSGKLQLYYRTQMTIASKSAD